MKLFLTTNQKLTNGWKSIFKDWSVKVCVLANKKY